MFFFSRRFDYLCETKGVQSCIHQRVVPCTDSASGCPVTRFPGNATGGFVPFTRSSRSLLHRPSPSPFPSLLIPFYFISMKLTQSVACMILAYGLSSASLSAWELPQGCTLEENGTLLFGNAALTLEAVSTGWNHCHPTGFQQTEKNRLL